MDDQETRRLAALRRYEILDTPAEPQFDSIAALAGRLFDVPLAMISMSDRERTWIKASWGDAPKELERGLSPCDLAIRSGSLIAIPDTTADERTSSLPMVTGPMGMRFHASAPLLTADRQAIGTLCIADRVPRRIPMEQLARLEDLAALVVDELELHRALRRNARVEAALRGVVEGVSDATGTSFLRSLVQLLTETLQTAYAFVSRTRSPRECRTVAVAGREGLLENFDYDVAGTPCELVLRQGQAAFLDHLQESFPRDEPLREMGAQSYLGVRLDDSTGKPLGVLSILDKKPLEDPQLAQSLLRIVAARAVGELERLEAVEALERSEERNRALVEAIPDLIFRLDREGRFVACKAGHAPDLYPPPEEFLGRRLEEVLPPDLAERSRRRAERVLKRGSVEVFEYEQRVPAGLQAFEARLAPCGEDQVVVIVRNITEKKKAEAAERSMLEAQRLRSLGLLAGGTAHDFNNLLVSIRWNAELALGQLPADSSLRPKLEDIDTASRRAAELARQLLAYAGKARFELQPLDLSEVMRETTRLLGVSVPEKITLRLELTESLPPVLADATQIRQVVMNLVTNAAEAIGGGPGAITVSTGVLAADRAYLGDTYHEAELEEGDYAYLEVEDSGAGMDAATRSRIFEPFFTTRRDRRGLGLAAVPGIVRGHRGTLKVSSEPGRGSAFRLLLPVAAGKFAASPEAGPGGQAHVGDGTVLVADDEESVRTVAREMLESLDYEVLSAADGLEAVRVFGKQADRISFVLLDMRMPGAGGEEVVGEIRRLKPDAKVILMSGYDEDGATDALKEPPAAFLQKPFGLNDLRDRIRRLA